MKSREVGVLCWLIACALPFLGVHQYFAVVEMPLAYQSGINLFLVLYMSKHFILLLQFYSLN